MGHTLKLILTLKSADSGQGCPPAILGCEWSYIGYNPICNWFKASGYSCQSNGRSVWCCNEQELPQ